MSPIKFIAKAFPQTQKISGRTSQTAVTPVRAEDQFDMEGDLFTANLARQCEDFKASSQSQLAAS